MPDRKNNLLIVEDDNDLRVLLAAILSQSGYKVRLAQDGFAALAEMRAELPDLILSDLYMLGMSGFELLSVVRRRFPAVPVIAMSSAFSGGSVPAGVAADVFYQKATGIVPLLQIVEKMAAPESAHLAPRGSDTVPIWIATHSAKSGVDDKVMIACPECLRTSSCIPGSSAAVIRQTECAYCRTHIHYAIVQTTDPGPPKELWQHRPVRQRVGKSVAA